MNEELTICRAIMRLYTCCEFDKDQTVGKAIADAGRERAQGV